MIGKDKTMENYFTKLYDINVNGKTEKKNGLTYLSWAWAWAEVKKLHPDATYTIYENAQGFNYHTDGNTCWVKTGVTINGLEHIEYLPVMDLRNKSIPAGNVTSFDVNKAIQRSLTKAVARHGLGLYLYIGEDAPEEEADAIKEEKKKESLATEEQIRIIGEHYADPSLLTQLLNYYKVDSIANLPRATADSLVRKIKAKNGG